MLLHKEELNALSAKTHTFTSKPAPANTHMHTVVPVAGRWIAASEGTPFRGRARGGGAELCPGCPVSLSGSPAASPSLSAC